MIWNRAVLVLVFASAPAFSDRDHAMVKLDVKQARLADVLISVADPNGAAVVMLEGADIKVDVRGEKPWQDVIAEQTRAHGLAYVREGELFVVATKKTLDARPKPASSYGGRQVDIELRDADPAAALRAISLAAEVPYGLGVVPKHPITIKLRHLPADQGVPILVESTGGKLDPKAGMPALPKACALPAVKSAGIRLAGTVIASVTDRYAVITDGGSTWDVVKVYGCVGSDGKTIIGLAPGRMHVGKTGDRMEQGTELRVNP